MHLCWSLSVILCVSFLVWWYHVTSAYVVTATCVFAFTYNIKCMCVFSWLLIMHESIDRERKRENLVSSPIQPEKLNSIQINIKLPVRQPEWVIDLWPSQQKHVKNSQSTYSRTCLGCLNRRPPQLLHWQALRAASPRKAGKTETLTALGVQEAH